MNILRLAMKYLRWYHVVGLLLGVTFIIGLVWWLKEHDRATRLGWDDVTDLVEPEI
jgi:hypothetical protein